MAVSGSPARYFSVLPAPAPAPEGGGPVRCGLCPHACVIQAGERGRCGVRANREGRGTLPFYGFITALAEDPVEKKPLYHFRPGSSILSAGFAGCNLHCPFCQNHHISREIPPAPEDFEPPGRRFSPEELAALARRKGFRQIAYTYSEPLVHAEYLLDCMAAARARGIANVLVSNGCVEAGAAADILALTDAANIDLKCFSGETYSRVLGGNLETVLAFIRRAFERGVHLEVTTLVVPGLNDGEEEMAGAAAFLAGISAEIPWHLSACHPAYRWNGPPTAPGALEKAAARAREQLRHVYTGNIPGGLNDTRCSRCGGVLVSRRGYRIDTGGLAPERGGDREARVCRYCGERAPFVY